MVDEMDLAKKSLQVSPLRPEAHERARADLRAALEEASGRGKVAFLKPRRRRTPWIGAGIGALAAGAAVVFAVSSMSQPATPNAPVAQGPVVESELISLATRLTAAGETGSGDASLVVRTQTIDGQDPTVSYNLYTDDGRYFGAADEASLRQAMGEGSDEGFSRIVANSVEAARFAVDGDLEEARRRMVDAAPNSLGLGLDEAARQKIWDETLAENADVYEAKGYQPPKNPPTGKKLEQLVGSHLWNQGLDALNGGSGSPEVRAGVLRLYASVPEVKVEKTTTEGQATLTLTAGAALSGGGAPQVLTVDAESGTPISLVSAADADVPGSQSTYQVSRVSVSDFTA
ncbi:hypothetical protein LWF15_00990 [Kineosporia rhizophila]|uniref:hypothetical protein n=1 Tax=Kineosporia rhizophila TaxID=84633 RepID=UPI001E46A7EA|nr:hypothetical protein [Kineosporia rhizophila]MCE0534082.1 hypothetical protein [Kineosporia rhizophila]